MNPLAKSLLPSSIAPSRHGPITSTPDRAGSPVMKSAIPSARGASGPTTTMPMEFAMMTSRTLSKSSGSTGRFTAVSAVPGLPGATKSFSGLLLWASFHAIACSRAPDPRIRIFIFRSFPISKITFRMKLLRPGSKNHPPVRMTSHHPWHSSGNGQDIAVQCPRGCHEAQ